MVQAPVSGNKAHVAGWGRPAGPVVSVVGIWPQWLSALVGWHCGAATQRLRRCRALCLHRAAAAPSSQCIFHRHYVCPSVPTQNEGDGLAKAPNLPSRLADGSEWRTSLEIVYTGWHTCAAMCGMHVIRYVGRRDNGTAVDIKAHTPLIRFVVVLLVCCIWPSFCTKWRAQTIWVTCCSPVVQCMWRLQQ